MMRTPALVVLLLLLARSHPAVAQSPDRTSPPVPGPPPSLKLPPIHRVHLESGLPLMLVEKHTVPLVQLTLVARTGSVRDPAGQEGLAAMTAALLTKGAGSRDALELAEAVDYLGARLTAEAGRHTSSVSLFTPRARLDEALELMADVLLRPAFSDSELVRERSSRLTTLLQWSDSPEVLADLALQHLLFGASHPYGRPVLGSAEGLAALSTEMLRDFHARYYHPGNVGLIAVGDITLEALQPRLEKVLAGWVSGPEIPGNVRPVKQVDRRRIFLLDQPGAAQTQIRVGCIGAPRITEDYDALTVMNTVLGGSFSSRLNTNLREIHGYGYGAGSEFDCRLLPGPFIAYSVVETGVTDSALLEIFHELERIGEPIQERELERAKNYLALGYPASFQTVSSIAYQLDEMATYGLPEDYFNRYVDNILSVSDQDVQRSAERYIDPARMLVVLVGDRAAIEQSVRALTLGPVETLTVDDLLGPLSSSPSRGSSTTPE